MAKGAATGVERIRVPAKTGRRGGRGSFSSQTARFDMRASQLKNAKLLKKIVVQIKERIRSKIVVLFGWDQGKVHSFE